MRKQLIACLLIIVLLFSIIPNAYAATSPYPLRYGSGTTTNDPVRYRDLYFEYLQPKHDGLLQTTAAFSININGTIIQSNDDTLQVTYAKVGDTAAIDATASKASSGHTLDMFDWQISFREYTSSTYVTKQLDKTVFKTKSFAFDAPGTYNFYLNVRDNTPYSMTEGWGNWSYNGVHRAIGINPGPTGSAADNIYGDWYYAQIQVIVQPDAPTASFIITHNGTDVTDNVNKKINRTTNNLVVNLVDNSNIKNGNITKREWKYWSSSGWTKIPGQGTNDTSITVDSAALGINPDRMGFQLTATSDKGMTANAAHDVYSTYASGIASIIVHYKDAKGATLAPDDTIKTDLDKPTTIYSIPIANYKADKASDVVTVPSSDPDKTIDYTFTYTYSPATPTIEVVAIIDAPDIVVMGNDVDMSGAQSYTTNPDAVIVSYNWTSSSPFEIVSGFTRTGDNSFSGQSGVIYFNKPGTTVITLEVQAQNKITGLIEKDSTKIVFGR
jgi:hypothetical protein